jgi:LysR family transcriptional regulator, glycine cleavage system transcriptional activator
MAEATPRLPPLAALIPFEAAARLGSMSAAARELGISQPAISRHLAGLEADLGQILFIRTRRGLCLTAAGRDFQGVVAPALDQIRQASGRLRPGGRHRTIRIAANFGFAQQWLMPRLPGMRQALPDLFLHLLTSDREEELGQAECDLAIRFGTGAWPGQRAVKLFDEEAFPVCSPDYLARYPALRDGDLAAVALLHMAAADAGWFTWTSWLAAQGSAIRPERPRLIYPTYPLLLQAALTGEGAALGWRGLVDDLLAEGRLVQLLPGLRRTDRGYFLCLPERPAGAAAPIRAVADWILASAEAALK